MQTGLEGNGESPIIMGVDIGYANCRLYFRSGNNAQWSPPQATPMAVCKNEKNHVISGKDALTNIERCENVTPIQPLKLNFDSGDGNREWDALCSLVFRRIWSEPFTSSRTDISRVYAAMSIPLHYSSKSVERLCRLFGLPDIARINEPEAAVLGYELDREIDGANKNVLVFNMGASRCWCVLLRLSEYSRTLHTDILASEIGPDDASGHAFEQALRQVLLAACPAMMDKLASITVNSEVVAASLDIKIQRAVLEYIRDPKKPIYVHHPLLFDGPVLLHGSEIEAAAERLATYVQELIDKTLNNGRVRAHDVDHTLPVGGMTQLPQVATALRPYHTRSTGADRERNAALICLSKGAARYAEMLNRVSASELRYAPPQHPIFGVMLEGNRFDVVVPADSPLNVKRTKVYRASSRETYPVRFEIYYGFSKGPSTNHKIGDITYTFVDTRKIRPDEVPLHLSMMLSATTSDFPDTLTATLTEVGSGGVEDAFSVTKEWREVNPGLWQERK